MGQGRKVSVFLFLEFVVIVGVISVVYGGYRQYFFATIHGTRLKGMVKVIYSQWKGGVHPVF